MGGPTGNVVTLNEGDFVLIPPGVSHQQLHATPGIFLSLLPILFGLKKYIFNMSLFIRHLIQILMALTFFLNFNFFFLSMVPYESSQKLDFFTSIPIF